MGVCLPVRSVFAHTAKTGARRLVKEDEVLCVAITGFKADVCSPCDEYYKTRQ